MPFSAGAGDRRLIPPLKDAIQRAADAGCRVFLCGMSRGFDLWAARAVLELREELGLLLWCALPYADQEAAWEDDWRALHREVAAHADQVYCLAERYFPGCYHDRNRFLVEGASRMICYFDGQPGGTAYTVRLARERGVYIDNLADPQLSFFTR